LNALNSSDFTKADDPFALFRRWFAEAAEKEINDPDAITLATVDSSGMPDARAMLCKQVDERGFVFYTNGQSVKGGEIAANPKAAILYHWKSLRRQVRARGPLTRISDAESDAYFATRPRVSRIGAWASQQSEPLESRAKLEQAVAELTVKFGDGDIPRPPHWGGFRLTPLQIEFWHDGQYRLHDRVVFTRAREGDPWRRERLYP
jgi:pyridoxamine 5'-phosphate oxidase